MSWREGKRTLSRMKNVWKLLMIFRVRLVLHDAFEGRRTLNFIHPKKKRKIRRKFFSLTHFRLFLLLCLPDTMKTGWEKFIRWSKSLTTMKRTLNDDGSEFSKFSDNHHQVADNGEDTTTTARSKKRRRRKKKRTRTQGRCRWEMISTRNLRTMTRRENLCQIEFNHALVADWQQVEKRIFLFY